MTKHVPSLERLLVGSFLTALLATPSCSDPPNAGALRIDIDRLSTVAGLTALDFTIVGAQIFYSTPPPAPTEDDQVCPYAGGTFVSVTSPQVVQLDLTQTGRTFVGGLTAPAGTVSEIRLFVAAGTVQSNGSTLPAHWNVECTPSFQIPSGVCDVSDPDEPPPGCEVPDEVGVLRLVPTTGQNVVVTANQTTEVAVQFDPATAITIVTDAGAGDDQNPVATGAKDPGNGHGDNGVGNCGDPGEVEACKPEEGDDEPFAAVASIYPMVVVPPAQGGAIVPDQVVVRFKDGTSPGDIQNVIARESATVLRSWARKNYFVLLLPSGSDEKSILEDLNGMSIVQYMSPNSVVETTQFDPNFPQQTQWPQVGLNELADGGPDPASAWGVTVGSFGSVAAVVDDGVDLSNPNLVPNLFINEAELPQNFIALDDGGFKAADCDHDGIVTFADLNNAMDSGVCQASVQALIDAACDGGATGTCNSCQPDGGPSPRGPICLQPVGQITGDNLATAVGMSCDQDCNGFPGDVVGWNFDDDSNRVTPTPLNVGTASSPVFLTHGTTVSGIIGAAGDDGIQTVGVNWHVRILPIKAKISATFSRTTRVFRDSVYSGFQYATLMSADVANASLGCYVTKSGSNVDQNKCNFQCGEYGLSDDKYNAFVQQLRAELADIQTSTANTVITVAAGNCGLNLDDPSLFEWPEAMTGANVLRVAAVGAAGHSNVDQLSTFSNFGVSATDLAAPGEFFVGLTTDEMTTLCPADTQEGCAGTSFAAPMVAGTAALLVAADKTLKGNSCRIADRVLRNADTNVGNLQNEVGTNGFRLNALRAVQNVVTKSLRGCP